MARTRFTVLDGLASFFRPVVDAIRAEFAPRPRRAVAVNPWAEAAAVAEVAPIAPVPAPVVVSEVAPVVGPTVAPVAPVRKRAAGRKATPKVKAAPSASRTTRKAAGKGKTAAGVKPKGKK